MVSVHSSLFPLGDNNLWHSSTKTKTAAYLQPGDDGVMDETYSCSGFRRQFRGAPEKYKRGVKALV